MLEGLIELVIEAFGELLLQAIFEILVELGFESVGNAFRPCRRANPILATTGVVFLGAAFGLISSLLLPYRLLPATRLPGLSVVLAPVAIGFVMHFFGRWRHRCGGHPTFLATFWGGAAFAFSLALVRWLMVGR
jgi:hypothetical protein